MGFVIVLIVIVALYVWYKTTHYNDSKWVKERIEGRTDEQKAVIRYFCNESACLSKKPISDDEYDRLVAAHLSEIDFKQKALNKIGLDEDQVKEIEDIARKLCEYPTVFYTCHCTGLEAFDIMKAVMGDKLIYVHSGDEIIL